MRRALQAVVTFTSLVIAGAGCGDDSSPGPTISSGDVDAGSDRMDPAALDKFVDPLPVLPAVRGFEEDGSLRQVTIGMWEIEQQLHRELPSTRVWAYGENEESASYPGPTIEARSGFPLEVAWQNNLPASHFLPVDTTIHWAAPPDWPGDGVPTTVHVHGGLQEAPSDGHPDAWFTRGFDQVGPGFVKETSHYSNQNAPETLWYHDHALGITRLNVYAGLAGFYLLRDPASEEALNLPTGAYERPLLIQDRSFNRDGSLFYPDEGVNPDVHPQWVPEFFGDVNLVNGVVWPVLEVEPRRYRFRILDGANARFYHLRLSGGLEFIQIGTDGGYLPAPVRVSSILLGPAERADVIVDFSGLTPGTEITLTNDAAAPYPGGDPPTEHTAQVMMFRVVEPGGPDTSSVPEAIAEVPTLDQVDAVRTLTLIEVEDPQSGQPLGVFLDGKRWGEPGNVTELPQIGTTEIWELVNLTDDAHPIHLHLIDFLILDRQEFDSDRYRARYEQLNPDIPATDETVTLPVEEYLTGQPEPPLAFEAGWKDTVRAPPGQVTRIVVRWLPESAEAFPFDPTEEPGYVWHCHILEHEDNEMMRRLQLVAPPSASAKRQQPATPPVGGDRAAGKRRPRP